MISSKMNNNQSRHLTEEEAYNAYKNYCNSQTEADQITSLELAINIATGFEKKSYAEACPNILEVLKWNTRYRGFKETMLICKQFSKGLRRYMREAIECDEEMEREFQSIRATRQ